MTKPIYVNNASTLVTDAQAETMTRVASYQLQHHVAPAWGRSPVTVQYTSNKKSPPAGSVLITIFDDSDSPGALGYHDETNEGVQYGRVFAKPVLDNGGDVLHKDLSVASVLSHEVIEWFADPSCNRWAEDAQGTLWALELGDPVENFSYIVSAGNDSATMSDFVLPAWFDPEAPLEHNLFDYLNKLTAPFTIAKNGYALTAKGGKISQKFGAEYPKWRKATKKSSLARSAKRKEPQS